MAFRVMRTITRRCRVDKSHRRRSELLRLDATVEPPAVAARASRVVQ